jgi:scyllo-inositol 2-dehydrogenase (NADP+)
MTNTDDTVVRVGIAGLGRSGWGLHAATIARLPELFRVTGVTDPLPARAEEAAAAYGSVVHGSVAELVKADDIDLLVVATPSTQHAAQAIEGLENGKHVLVEKPFAVTLAEADEMAEVARRTGRLLVSSQNLRYAADFQKVREVVGSGRLGTILQITIRQHAFRRRWDWQTLRELGGGALNNDASHLVDQALLLLGGDAEPQVTARVTRTPLSLGDAEDHVKILLSVPAGPLVDIEISNACAYPQDRWLVSGTRGTLVGGGSRLRWRYLDTDLLTAREVSGEPVPDRSYGSEDLPWVQEECDLTGETYANSHVRLYRRLHDTIHSGRPADITTESIRRQIAVLERCRAAGIDDIERINL